MSVLIRIKNIKTLLKGNEKIVLFISTENEEIQFSNSISTEQKEIGLFLIDKKIKKIQFTIKLLEKNLEKNYAGCQFFLYDVYDLPSKPITLRKLGLKSHHQEIKESTYEDRIYEQYIVIQLELKSKRRILKQIQKLSELPYQVPELISQPSMTIVQTKIEDKPAYQQINLNSEVKQSQPKYNQTNICQSKLEEKIQLKILKQNLINFKESKLQQQDKKKNQPFISIQFIKDNVLENISSIHPNLQQKRGKNPKKRSPQQSNKPLIFQRMTQRDHIGINTNANTFQIYHMCCGDQIDYSHQLQQSY